MASRGKNPKVAVKSTFDDKGTKQGERALDRLQKQGSKSLGGLTKHALGYGAALVGGAGVVGALESSVEASLAAEKAEAKLDAQLKAVGISYKDNAKEIDHVVARTSAYSGFLDKDLESALANIVRSTGDLHKSYDLLNLATDVARAKNIDVASAGQMVGRVYAGNVRVLKSLGITLDPVTKAQDKLKESTKHATDEQKRAAVAADKTATSQKAIGLLQQKLGGQAKAYGDTTAGSMDKFKAAVDRLEVKLGNALAPTLKKVADKASTFVTQMTDGTGAGGRFAAKMQDVAHDVGQVLGVVKDVAVWLGKHPGLLKAAAGAWVAYKTVAIANLLETKLVMMGIFSAKSTAGAEAAAGKAGARAGRAYKAAFIVGATVGLYNELVGPFNAALEKITGQIDATDPTNGGAQKKADQRSANKYGSPKNQPKNAPRLQKTDPKYLPKLPKAKTHKASVATARSSLFAGVVARAASGSVSGDTAGLNGDFLNRLRQMSAGTGIPISVQSGFRTAAEQQALVNQKGIWSPSNPTGAAPVGSSMHEKGLAADISPGRERFGAVCGRYGLSFPISAEPWHCQPSGTAASRSPAATTGSTPAARSGPTPAERAKTRATNRANTRGAETKAIKQAAAQRKKETTAQAKYDKARIPKFTPVNTLRNPWLQAALNQNAGNPAAQIQILQNAIPSLPADEARNAQKIIDSLTPPEDTGVADEDAREAHIDALVRAGDLTPEEGRQAKIASIDDALANWNLSDEARLTLRGERKDLVDQGTQDNTDAVKALTEELAATRTELEKQNKFAEQVTAVSLGQLWGAVADLVSGQIAGFGGYGGRTTVGAGAVARY